MPRVKAYCTCGRPRIASTCPCGRGYGHRWNEVSKRVRKARPLCEQCNRNGKTTPATEVHHIAPIRDDPSRKYDETNLMALCNDCHNEIEAQERATSTKRPGVAVTGGPVF